MNQIIKLWTIRTMKLHPKIEFTFVKSMSESIQRHSNFLNNKSLVTECVKTRWMLLHEIFYYEYIRHLSEAQLHEVVILPTNSFLYRGPTASIKLTYLKGTKTKQVAQWNLCGWKSWDTFVEESWHLKIEDKSKD